MVTAPLVICFLAGQHRSGSSAIAGSLSILGGHLGKSYVAENSRFNPRGYFENQEFVRLNEQILSDFGSYWSDTKRRSVDYRRDSSYWHEKRLQLRNLIREEVIDSNGVKRDPLIIKDPRISLLMPFYEDSVKSMEDFAPRFVFCRRRIDRNIQSLVSRGALGTRNGFFGRAMTEKWARQLIEKYDRIFHDDFSGHFPLVYHSLSNLSSKPVEYLRQFTRGLGLNLSFSKERLRLLELFLDRERLSGEAAEGVKVVSTYFGKRRRFPKDSCETKDLLNELMSVERTVDPGDALDTVIVLHRDRQANQDALGFVHQLAHVSTRFGKVQVLIRPWEKGVGGSFRSFDFAFQSLRDSYSYWIFQEDNGLIIGDRYFSHGRKQLSSSRATFVGFARHPNHVPMITDGEVKQGRKRMRIEQKLGHSVWHAHGGCGIASRETLDKIVEAFGALPFSRQPRPVSFGSGGAEESSWYRRFELDGEVKFTAVHYLVGGRVVDANAKNPLYYYPFDGVLL